MLEKSNKTTKRGRPPYPFHHGNQLKMWLDNISFNQRLEFIREFTYQMDVNKGYINQLERTARIPFPTRCFINDLAHKNIFD